MTVNVAVVMGVVVGAVQRIDVPRDRGPGARFSLSVRSGDPALAICQDALVDVLAFERRAEVVLATLRVGAQVLVKGRLLSLDGAVLLQADWIEVVRGGR